MNLVSDYWSLVAGKKKLLLAAFVLLVTSYQLPATSFAQSTPTPKVAPTGGGTKEENAVYKTNRATMPEGVIKTEKSLSNNILSRIINVISDFKSLFFSISDAPKFYAQSDSLSQGNLPNEARPEKKNTDIIDNLRGFLGGKGPGFYGVSSAVSPSAEQDKIKSYEQLREKSFYPEEIKPITGR